MNNAKLGRFLYGKILVVIILTALGIWVSWYGYQLFSDTQKSGEIIPEASIIASGIEVTPEISAEDLRKGWYYGTFTQKKLGTPADWIYQDAGRSSCWHMMVVRCGINQVPAATEM